VPWLVVANVWAATLAGLLGFFWFAIQVRAANARHLVEWTTDLRLLDSAEFEWLVGELFRREGWQVEEVGRRGTPDGNIDLELVRAGTRRIVQCKRWAAWLVGVDEIRSFAGTLMREGLPGSSGVYVTLSDFSPQARDEGKRIGLVLIDNEGCASIAWNGERDYLRSITNRDTSRTPTT
jgi:restriction endonuclease Mrr